MKRARREKLQIEIDVALGRLVPVSAVEVRPQLSGVISRVHVREGQTVRVGSLRWMDELGLALGDLAPAAQRPNDVGGVNPKQPQQALIRPLPTK